MKFSRASLMGGLFLSAGLYFAQSGSLTLPKTGLSPNPGTHRIAIDASLWIRYAGDQAQEVHHYLDVLMLLQQIGAMPAPAH